MAGQKLKKMLFLLMFSQSFGIFEGLRTFRAFDPKSGSGFFGPFFRPFFQVFGQFAALQNQFGIEVSREFGEVFRNFEGFARLFDVFPSLFEDALQSCKINCKF